jgi:hypothetical protein
VGSTREIVAFLEDEHRAVWGLNPTANLSETQNATFWVRVGGKRPYLGRGEVVLQEASNNILQIVRTRHFEKTGKGGGGPTEKDLLEKGEERRKWVEETRDRARRMTAESVENLARGAGLATGGSPGGVMTVVRNAERVRRGKSLVESTHRHDRVMVEFEREARGVKRSREVTEQAEKGERFYEEVAVCIAEGFCSLDDLDEDERRKVVDFQKMAAAGKRKEDENMQRVESERSDAMDVDGKEGESGEKESTSGRGKEAEEYTYMIRRMAQERIAARGGGGSGAGNAGGSEGGSGNGQRDERGGGSDGRREEERSAVPLQGEERYEERGWAIAKLKRGDESGCVGVRSGGKGRCSVTSFERTRDRDASGVLVLFK